MVLYKVNAQHSFCLETGYKAATHQLKKTQFEVIPIINLWLTFPLGLLTQALMSSIKMAKQGGPILKLQEVEQYLAQYFILSVKRIEFRNPCFETEPRHVGCTLTTTAPHFEHNRFSGPTGNHRGLRSCASFPTGGAAPRLCAGGTTACPGNTPSHTASRGPAGRWEVVGGRGERRWSR